MRFRIKAMLKGLVVDVKHLPSRQTIRWKSRSCPEARP
jgi:hypothetical protein